MDLFGRLIKRPGSCLVAMDEAYTDKKSRWKGKLRRVCVGQGRTEHAGTEGSSVGGGAGVGVVGTAGTVPLVTG